MSRIAITEADLLEALAKAAKGTAPGDARTVTEMADETGMNIARIRKALRSFQKEGRLAVHAVHRPALDGKMRPTTAYTVAAKARK